MHENSLQDIMLDRYSETRSDRGSQSSLLTMSCGFCDADWAVRIEVRAVIDIQAGRVQQHHRRTHTNQLAYIYTYSSIA